MQMAKWERSWVVTQECSSIAKTTLRHFTRIMTLGQVYAQLSCAMPVLKTIVSLL